MKPLLPILVAAFLCQSAKTFGQVKIGNNPTTINADAVLEAETTNKGFLLPRIALTATNSASPLSAHTAGMAVYNTATAGSAPFNVSPGIYYNNGSGWTKLDSVASGLTSITLTNPTTMTNSGNYWDYKFQTAAGDAYNEYSTATGKFTASRTGTYVLTCYNLATCNVGPINPTVLLRVNSQEYAGSVMYVSPPGGGAYTVFIVLTIKLNAGDVVYPRGYGPATGTCTIDGTTSRTFMTIAQIR
ncbi:hypothetical protein Q4E93_18900 [Flavitalea sp. BT771]|uniref:hypothetical protein n=1 Tax=Flavitalea sp. BT771 TaxID=3063329 RepID=UPI0026E1C44E|nr:hypothetical protein [Flavitalea sp. BT771]MDO6432682.1 hypothetical protein [Flavitalea sp. BT771]MDV6222042.1 hypothetical protein [Flavitalea sp. BT771]